MDLQYALILIGIVIVTVVAVTAFDKARVSRAPRDARSIRESGITIVGPEPRVEIPVTPLADPANKFLRTDAEITPRGKTRQEVLRQELKSLEEVATLPLNLAAGLRPRGFREPEPGREYAPDAKIDFVIHFPGTPLVSRNMALGIFKQHEYKLNKPRHLYGLRYQSNQWSDLELDPEKSEYEDLKIAIQIVDGKGPIDESEINIFIQLGLQLADALARPTRLPLTVEEGLARARETQQFCETYDVIASIHVVPGAEAVFPGRVIEMAARQTGMQFGPQNIFHMRNDLPLGGRYFFSMANQQETGQFDPQVWDTFTTPGLVLFMNVPCAHHPAVAFDKMVTAAKGLCDILGGRLQDQDHHSLTDKGIAVIRHQIEEIGDKMEAFGIPAGSKTALKLFNEDSAS